MTVTLNKKWEEHIQRYAEAVVNAYADGVSPRSKACVVAGRPPIFDNIEVQACGRRAEVAFCGWLGLDPHKYLKWEAVADSGYDLAVDPFYIDVKSSPLTNARYLIWPVSKTHFFNWLTSNILVLVRPTLKQYSFGIVGWTTKEWFANNHETSTEGDSTRLTPGTWFMRQENLWESAALRSVIKETASIFRLEAA